MNTTGTGTKQQRLWQRGQALFAQRQWQAAADCFLAIADHDASHVPAWLQAADSLLAIDRYRDARRCVLAAGLYARRFPELAVRIAHRLRGIEESHALFAVVADVAPLVAAPTVIELASLVSSAGEQALAGALLNRALAAAPDSPDARYLSGALCLFEGDGERAETELELCLHFAPAFAQAHWMLSGIEPKQGRERRVARIHDALKGCMPGSNAEAYLQFALHAELHALKRHEDAWSALERGNAVRGRLVRYDPDRSADLFHRIKVRCTERFIADGADDGPRDDGACVPIFIVGMHRSGTSLLERILGGHSMVADGGETHLFPAQLAQACDHQVDGALDAVVVERAHRIDFDAVGRDFLAASAWRARGKSWFTEKLPSNMLNAGFIAKALPRARILHLVRDPVDTCFSNWRTYFGRAAPHAFDQLQLADYFVGYRDLMRHWHAVMPHRILDVPYDDLVGDTEAVARRVFGFCGLGFEARALEVSRRGGMVATASHAQVRRGILRDRGGAWQPYRRQLQPMLDRLAELGAG